MPASKADASPVVTDFTNSLRRLPKRHAGCLDLGYLQFLWRGS